MPQKLNKAGKMQDYIPAGNGDPSGEYGTSKGTNKNFTTSDKKSSKANVITENKSVVVGDKGKTYDHTSKKPLSVKTKKETFDVGRGDKATFDVLDELPNGWRKIDGALTAPRGYTWVSNNESLFNGKREQAIIKTELLETPTKANVIDNDLTKTFGENEKYDKSYSNNPELEEKLKSNIAEKLNEEFKGKSDEYIRQNGFTIAKGIASSEIRKDEFKDLKFNSFGSDSSNFDNMVRASLEQRKIGIKKTII